MEEDILRELSDIEYGQLLRWFDIYSSSKKVGLFCASGVCVSKEKRRILLSGEERKGNLKEWKPKWIPGALTSSADAWLI